MQGYIFFPIPEQLLIYLAIAVVSCLFLILLYILTKLILFKSEYFPNDYVSLALTPPSRTEKTAYSTEQLFKYLHSLCNQQSFIYKLFGVMPSISLEIVSSQDLGIRFVVRVKKRLVQSVQQAMRSYLPFAKISEADDYISIVENSKYQIVELTLSNHYAYPLKDQSTLEEHDPLSYITGMMTKLQNSELIALQYVLSPAHDAQAKNILRKILSGMKMEQVLQNSKPVFYITAIISPLIWGIRTLLSDIFNSYSSKTSYHPLNMQPNLSQFEKDLQSSIKYKLEQSLFNVRVRFLVRTDENERMQSIIQGIGSAMGIYATTYQTFRTKKSLYTRIFPSLTSRNFKLRVPSFHNNETILSVSEISDLYHFPFASSNQVENVAKVHSKKLPPPLSLKGSPIFDNTFAVNNYGGSVTPIGLKSDERARHMYIIGATGSGKSTLLYKMISEDINNGKSVCAIDPHGDLALSVLDCVPHNRISDVIYFNPFDIAHPIGINLLETEPHLSMDDRLLEQEFVTESVVSLFRKVFSEGSSGHPHRIEYILRNTIHTAFTTENPTIFTIFNLLNDPAYQKDVVSKLQDENLLNFWKYEFGKAGDYQKIKMVSPVTARIGRFLFSPSAKRVLEQEKSTINFDHILNQNKILICNLSKGNIGEDTSEVIGVMLLNKLQLALLKRSRSERKERKPLYLYVDEFQNFATPSFVQMLSESRKYGLHLTIAEQSTSQQEDRQMVNTILANVGNVVSFRTANPQDEDLLLRQFSPYVAKGDLPNLPAYNFYMKTSALEPEEPFSGETIVSGVNVNYKKRENIIASSRELYAITYIEKEKVDTPPKQRRAKKNKKETTTTESENFSVFPEGV